MDEALVWCWNNISYHPLYVLHSLSLCVFMWLCFVRSVCGPCLLSWSWSPPKTGLCRPDVEVSSKAPDSRGLAPGVHHHRAQSKLCSQPLLEKYWKLYVGIMLSCYLDVSSMLCHYGIAWCGNRMFKFTAFSWMSEASDCKWWTVTVRVPTYVTFHQKGHWINQQ